MEYKSGAVRPIDSISRGFELIKSDYWTFFGMSVITGIAVIAVALMLAFINNLISAAITGGLGMATENSGDIGKASAAIVPQLIAMVISLFGNIIVATLSGMLVCGIYSALARKADTGVADFGDLSNGFQKLVPCLIAGVITAIIQFVIGVVMLFGGAAVGVSALGIGGLIGADGMPNTAALGGLVAIIFAVFAVYIVISIFIAALSTFVYPLIADKHLSGVEAYLMSIKSGFSNLGGLILLIILSGLMALGGAFVCLVGVLFVVPIIYAAWFVAYRDVFGGSREYRQDTPPPPPPNFQNQPGY